MCFHHFGHGEVFGQQSELCFRAQFHRLRILLPKRRSYRILLRSYRFTVTGKKVWYNVLSYANVTHYFEKEGFYATQHTNQNKP